MEKSPQNSPRSRSSKTKIIQSYLALMLDKRWDKITVTDICTKAAITRGTFYSYFNDIYDLVESIEEPLLEELSNMYAAHSGYPLTSTYSPEKFLESFDYSPPERLVDWFVFCKKHRDSLVSLLSANGNPYFHFKLRRILREAVNQMMDADHMPRDDLRLPFEKAFLELHFLAAQSWISSGDKRFLPISEIINLLNTMRVGANYLTYRRIISPDFQKQMYIDEEKLK